MSELSRCAVGLLCVLLATRTSLVAADSASEAVRAFEQLPQELRLQINTGEPRSSKQIAKSPFGTSSVVCFEQSGTTRRVGLSDAIAAAGYKWVGEYLQVDWSKRPTQGSERPSWGQVPRACIEYLVSLQAHGIERLMRLDPLPTQMLIGRTPTTDEDLALAAAYTRRVVSQLKPYVRHWQLGNEPNVVNAPEAYVRVFGALARAVRKEQPDAVIYGPGAGMLQCLADKPYPWLLHALRAGLLKLVDVFSFHPYRANGDAPERASEFARWRFWPSYSLQLEALRKALHVAGGRTLRLAVTEDGEASAISASGEQRVTPVIDAKHELRRSLLDFAQGISPRLHFTFFRNLPDTVYNREGSFNTVSASLDKRPLYYAAQNLHAVLDSSYEKTEKPKLSILERSTHKPPSAGAEVQTYLKHHAKYDELLVFFWAPVLAQDTHLRVPITLQLSAAGWEAPILIDLMTMPGSARPAGPEASEHQRATFPQARRSAAGLQLETLELRDYPQLLKLIRVTRAP